MDKLVQELIELLRQMLATQERLLAIANARLEAIKTFDAGALNGLLERERVEVARAQQLDMTRANLVSRFAALFGRGVPTTTSEIASRCREPEKTQLLVIAGQLRESVEKLQRVNRINSKVSQSVVTSLSKVVQIITGVAQQAGLYMRNGRKSAIKGIHMLDAVG